MNTLALILSGLAFLVVMVYTLALLVPWLSLRLMGQYAPKRFSDPEQRRLAVRLTVLQIGAMLGYALNFLIRGLEDGVAPPWNDILAGLGLVCIFAALACMIAAGRTQNRLRLLAPQIRAVPGSHRRVRILFIALILAVAVGAIIYSGLISR